MVICFIRAHQWYPWLKILCLLNSFSWRSRRISKKTLRLRGVLVPACRRLRCSGTQPEPQAGMLASSRQRMKNRRWPRASHRRRKSSGGRRLGGSEVLDGGESRTHSPSRRGCNLVEVVVDLVDLVQCNGTEYDSGDDARSQQNQRGVNRTKLSTGTVFAHDQ